MFEKDMHVADLLDCYGDLLSENKRNLIDLYYNEDYSLSEIAENAGMTRQGVRDSIKKSETELRAWEDKLHFVQKIGDANEKIARAAEVLASMEQTEDVASVLSILRSIGL